MSTATPIDAEERAAPRDAFDFRGPVRRLLAITRRHWLVVAITIALTLGAAVAYMTWRPPVYQAQLVLVVEPKEDVTRDRFYDQWNLFRKEEAENEIELIVGGPVLGEVIERMSLRWDDVYHPMSSQLTRWWELSDLGNWYRGLKERWFPKEPSPWQLTEEQKEKVRTLLDLRTAVVLEPVEGTHVGKLKVSGPSPRVAEMANTIAEVYIQQRRDRQIAEATAAFEALTRRVTDAKARSDALQQELRDYRDRNGIYFDFEREQGWVQQWTKVEAGIVEKRALVARLRKELEVVDALTEKEPAELLSQRITERNQLKNAARQQLFGLEVNRTEKLQRFQPDAPEVREVDALVASVREQMGPEPDLVPSSEATARNTAYDTLREKQGTLRASLVGAEAELAVLEDTERSFQRRLATLSGNQSMVQDLIERVQQAKAEYQTLWTKQIQAEVSRETLEKSLPTMRVNEKATPPEKPIWPRRSFTIVAALFLGTILGVLAAYLAELVGGRVWTHHVEGGRHGTPYLGRNTVRARDLRRLTAGRLR